jgi:3-methylcrotonyl-CoA carboxylase beta subunit
MAVIVGITKSGECQLPRTFYIHCSLKALIAVYLAIVSATMASKAPSREALLLLKHVVRSQAVRGSNRTSFNLRSRSRCIATHTHSQHASQISVLPTAVDTASADFKSNRAAMDEVTSKLTELHQKFAQGGPAKAREKHIARGKMLPRE